ncbi:MAG: hypothetical protein IJB73_08000 [Firmicutes bacterium]|nr:hypothetical protein [Bacillota bacterium]
MKKKFLSLLLAGVMIFASAACGAQEPAGPVDSTDDSDSTQQSQDVSTEDTVVVVDGMELGSGLIAEEEPLAEVDANPDRDIDRAVEPIKPVFDTMLDGTPLTEKFYYYRGTLDETYQQAYDLIRSHLMKGSEQFSMTVPVKKEDFFDIYKKVIYDSPELFWAEVNGSCYSYNNAGLVVSFKPGYNDLVEDIEGNTAALEEATAEALADMWSLDTDAEKAKYAHDWLIYNIKYNLDAPYNQTSFSALAKGSTVCAGYAHGFQYMMQQMGIPCAYILGYTAGGYHAWNIVKLDGKHYAMDVTWDDPINGKKGKYYYTYFNITDKKMSKDHEREDISAVLPVAKGTACSYKNAFGGNSPGTDFKGIKGKMPEKIQPEQSGDDTGGNPYLS